MTEDEMGAICANVERAFYWLIFAMAHTLDKACFERGVKTVETVVDLVKEFADSLP